jgi:hypothetical protein
MALSGALTAVAEAQDVAATTTYTTIKASFGTEKDVTLLAPPDTPATLEGTLNYATGDFVVPVSGYKFPTLRKFNALGVLPVQLKFTPNKTITGHADLATGATTSTLDSRVDITLIGNCFIPSQVLQLSTTGQFGSGTTTPSDPVRAGDPFDPDGALVGTWQTLPTAQPVNPALVPDQQCAALVNGAAGTVPGGIQLSGSFKFDPPPKQPENQNQNQDQSPAQQGQQPATPSGGGQSAPPPGTLGARDEDDPRIGASRFRSRCLSKGVATTRFSIRDASPISKVAVYFDGERVRLTKSTKVTHRVRVDRLRPGGHMVTVRVSDGAGNRSSRTVKFRVCG